MKEQFGLRIEVIAKIPEQHATTPVTVFLFRAAREMIFNVSKHAGVKAASVSIASTNGTITLTVSGQGRGFDPTSIGSVAKAGFGLLSIRERAAYIGGSLTIESKPGKGSCLTLSVPFKSSIASREALHLARLIRPDLIVMDVSMPVMDGIEATRRIKAEMPEIHVIGLSMHEDEQVDRRIRDAGADAFVSKTISAAELINVIYGVTGDRTS